MVLDCFFPFEAAQTPPVDGTEAKVAILRSGRTQKSIADALGITRQYLNQVLAGDRKAPHIRRRFAEVTGIPIETPKEV